MFHSQFCNSTVSRELLGAGPTLGGGGQPPAVTLQTVKANERESNCIGRTYRHNPAATIVGHTGDADVGVVVGS